MANGDIGGKTMVFRAIGNVDNAVSALKRLQNQLGGTTKEISKFDLKTDRLLANAPTLQGTIKGFKDMGATAKKELEKMSSSVKKETKGMNQFASTITRVALSMMFFGMALSRVFGGLISTSISTFQKTLESSNVMVRTMTPAYIAANTLAASWEYLKFSIADTLMNALLPFIPAIITLTNNIADFIQQHPETVFVALGLALGGIALASFASVILFINALVSASATLGTMGLASIFTDTPWNTIKAGVTGLGTSVSNLMTSPAFLNFMAWAAAGVAIFFAVKEAVNAYDDIKDGHIITGITEALSSLAFAGSGIMFLKGAAGKGGALLAIGVALKLMSEDVFFTDLLTLVGKIVGVVGGMLEVIKQEFSSGIKNIIWDAIKLIEPFILFMPSELQDAFKNVMGLGGGTQADLGAAFSSGYMKTFQNLRGLGKNLDESIAIMKEQADININAPSPQEIATNSQNIIYAENQQASNGNSTSGSKNITINAYGPVTVTGANSGDSGVSVNNTPVATNRVNPTG